MNRWTTALAAHASDMSNWLFMAYPGGVFLSGGKHLWAAVGLTAMMGLNWHFISRIMSIIAACVAMCIALGNFASIDTLVFYAWSGLGGSFGPLLIMSLYAKRITSGGALMGMLAGGLISAFWPLFGFVKIPVLIISFPISFSLIYFCGCFKTSNPEMIS